MQTNTRRLQFCGLLTLALMSCQPVQTQTAASASTPTATALPAEEEHPVPATPPPITPDVEFAIADLAQRLNVNPDAIAVVRVEEVDWPDGGLGCPQPDMNYRQMLTNGTFIQLSVGGQYYNYHSGGSRQPFLCISKDEVLPEDLPAESRGNPDI